MLAYASSLIVFALSTIIAVNGLDNLIENLDGKLVRNYADEDVLDYVKNEMSKNGLSFEKDWLVFPDGNGFPRIALLRIPKNGNIIGISNEGRFADDFPVSENVRFKLYTKDNPEEGLSLDKDNLESINFDPSKPTKIIIHGWQSSGDSRLVYSIRDAYMKKFDVNAIGVDWSGPAGQIFYPAAASYTKKVGRYVGSLIDDLVLKKNVRYEDIHVIGHSLGAHAAGITGFSTDEKISRITGLDPALPCFQDVADEKDSLDSSDAEFVEVIHTCAGVLGFSKPIGHADFFPNGGSPFQPGCCCIGAVIHACSHGRSYEYFAESILSEEAFESRLCKNWQDFKAGKCKNVVKSMGEFTPIDTRGVFYLKTDSQSPFGLGDDGLNFSKPLL